jgi:hypothetical protein
MGAYVDDAGDAKFIMVYDTVFEMSFRGRTITVPAANLINWSQDRSGTQTFI